jgi:outer membrane lipoprotein-sorting protein
LKVYDVKVALNGRVKDAKISFTQEIKFGTTGTEQSFAGRFYMKKGNKYRIEMEDQTIVTDGESVWRYTSINNQLIIDKYREDPRGFQQKTSWLIYLNAIIH